MDVSYTLRSLCSHVAYHAYWLTGKGGFPYSLVDKVHSSGSEEVSVHLGKDGVDGSNAELPCV